MASAMVPARPARNAASGLMSGCRSLGWPYCAAPAAAAPPDDLAHQSGPRWQGHLSIAFGLGGQQGVGADGIESIAVVAMQAHHRPACHLHPPEAPMRWQHHRTAQALLRHGLHRHQVQLGVAVARQATQGVAGAGQAPHRLHDIAFGRLGAASGLGAGSGPRRRPRSAGGVRKNKTGRAQVRLCSSRALRARAGLASRSPSGCWAQAVSTAFENLATAAGSSTENRRAAPACQRDYADSARWRGEFTARCRLKPP